MPVHSEFKNARIYVDGKPHPDLYLYKVETAGGLVLDAGDHVLRFELKYCKPLTKRIRVAAGQRALPQFVYRCQPRPAAILMKSSTPDLPIRRADTNTIIGRTNQKVTIPVSKIKSRVDLTIGTPGGRFAARSVTLDAGQLRTLDTNL
jgi:hypothetical protein